MRIRKGVMQNHLQFSVISMVYLALMALFVLHQSADGYQLRRRPSFLAPRRNLKPKTTSVTSSKQNHLKRNYRNEIHPQEDEEVRLDDTISSSLPSPTTTTSSHQHMQKKRKRRILQSPLIVGRKPKATVRTVDELRHAILDQGLRLSDVAIVSDQSDEESLEGPASIPTDFFHNHAVRELIKERYQQQSTPGRRLANDTSILALSIEGGGMRGCVSAGMVAAIASLGLTDTIDRVYGSSAGSVVGAYLVSRQVCMDVYVDILPAAQKLFVCKKRMIKSLASSLVDVLVSSLRKENVNNKKASKEDAISPAQLNPGMNISFVLDGIMGKDHGIRPLDIETFRQNDAKQPLRVVSSTIDPETGRLYSKCWGSRDFFNVTAVEKADGTRKGLFACLEASMTVPGATGPPVRIRQSDSDHILPCFDAFCFEPIPYRSAVEEGATHVLVLSSRPEKYHPKTRPGVYETGVAPLYFHSHGHSGVADFFEKGGQQYLYAEDLLALEHAKTKKVDPLANESECNVLVPPPEILYGVPETPGKKECIANRDTNWKRAHLMPLRVPRGHKELPTLEQGKDAVLEAVRGGFATAFDSLSSIVGLDHIAGMDAARLVFPDDEESDDAAILGSVMQVPGEEIPEPALQQMTAASSENHFVDNYMNDPFDFARVVQNSFPRSKGLVDELIADEDLSHHTLLAILPGFQGGRFGHLSRGLRNAGPTKIGDVTK